MPYLGSAFSYLKNNYCKCKDQQENPNNLKNKDDSITKKRKTIDKYRSKSPIRRTVITHFSPQTLASDANFRAIFMDYRSSHCNLPTYTRKKDTDIKTLPTEDAGKKSLWSTVRHGHLKSALSTKASCILRATKFCNPYITNTPRIYFAPSAFNRLKTQYQNTCTKKFNEKGYCICDTCTTMRIINDSLKQPLPYDLYNDNRRAPKKVIIKPPSIADNSSETVVRVTSRYSIGDGLDSNTYCFEDHAARLYKKLKWVFRNKAERLPSRKGEVVYRLPWTDLVQVFLDARSRDFCGLDAGGTSGWQKKNPL